MFKINNFIAVILAFALLAFSGCDDSNNSSGTISLQLTDDPFPSDEVASTEVTIDRVEIRSADDDAEDPFITLSTETQTFNLLELRNEVVAPLASAEIQAGLYDQVRLFVSDATVTLRDGQTFDLNIPSGAETGIKVTVAPDIEVSGNISAELLLDFDIGNSFVPRGEIGKPGFNGFIFKPVIRAANLSRTGRITGDVVHQDTVGNVSALTNAQVWVTRLDTVFSSTFSDAQGTYALIGLPAATYNLHATKTDIDTTTIENVTVTAGNETEQNIEIGTVNN